jgi:hypothetical protein
MVQCFGPGSRGQIDITVKVNVASANHTLQLWASATQADKVEVLPYETTLFYQRLS